MASPSAAIFWAEAHFTLWTLAGASAGQSLIFQRTLPIINCVNIKPLFRSPPARMKDVRRAGRASLAKSRALAFPGGGMGPWAGGLEEAEQAARRFSEILYRRLLKGANP